MILCFPASNKYLSCVLLKEKAMYDLRNMELFMRITLKNIRSMIEEWRLSFDFSLIETDNLLSPARFSSRQSVCIYPPLAVSLPHGDSQASSTSLSSFSFISSNQSNKSWPEFSFWAVDVVNMRSLGSWHSLKRSLQYLLLLEMRVLRPGRSNS